MSTEGIRLSDTARFHTQLVPGAQIKWFDLMRNEEVVMTVYSVDWKQQVATVTSNDGTAALVHLSDVLDILPDREDIEDVEQWLEQEFVNPYTRRVQFSPNVIPTAQIEELADRPEHFFSLRRLLDLDEPRQP